MKNIFDRIGAISVLASLALVSPPISLGQNEVFHYDGTTEISWRGTNPTAPKTVLQRLPGDQVAGRTGVASMVAVLQDQNYTTPQTFEYKIRLDNL